MNCIFCGKALHDGNPIRGAGTGSGDLYMHDRCYWMSIVLTAAKNWELAERDLRAHHHAREDNGGDFQYVPENLATTKRQAEDDLFMAVQAWQQREE